MTKINLYVVYEDRELAKKDGAFFNPELKTWQCEENNERCIKKYKRFYFNAGYDQREYIKALGAKWDSDEKKWYCSMGHKILIEEFVFPFYNK